MASLSMRKRRNRKSFDVVGLLREQVGLQPEKRLRLRERS